VQCQFGVGDSRGKSTSASHWISFSSRPFHSPLSILRLLAAMHIPTRPGGSTVSRFWKSGRHNQARGLPMRIKQEVTEPGPGQPSELCRREGTFGLKYKRGPRGVADWPSALHSAKSAKSFSNASPLGAEPQRRTICLIASPLTPQNFKIPLRSLSS
jgi:hypothetical protein